MRRSLPKLLLASSVAALGLAGCVIHGSEADVNVAWDFQGLTCRDAGVHTVALTLEDYDGMVFEQVTADCLDGSITIRDLPAGIYSLNLEGIGGPYAWYEGDEVELFGGENDFLVHLAAYEIQ